MKTKYLITDIILVNGTRQNPRKSGIVTTDLERVRKHYRELYPDYEIFFNYKQIAIDNG